MAERDIERYFRQLVANEGGITRKWVSPGQRGVPDQVVGWPNGVTHYVELKDNNVATEQQAREHALWRSKGHWVFVIASQWEIEQYVSNYLHGKYAGSYVGDKNRNPL